MMHQADNIKKAAEAIFNADALFITAGAGMGVDSGLPDFRGNEGFWKAYPPIARLGISFNEMANPGWFIKKPKLAWAFYGHRLNLYRKTTPHNGFTQLLKMAENKTGGYFVFTSNVDGQFQKAGFDDEKIVECHGSIHHLQCTNPCTQDIWNANEINVKVNMESFTVENQPLCMHCQSIARPNILMFGDWNWIADRTDQQHDLLNNWFTQNDQANNKLVIIECGAGTAVPTVRYTSEKIADYYNALLIRINPREHVTPSGHLSIKSGAAEGINNIFEELQ